MREKHVPIPISDSMINLANRTTAFSNFKPSKGSNDQIWVQDLWQFLFQTLIRLNEWLWDQEKCQIRFSSHKSLKSTNSSSSSREKHAITPISDPKKSKALNLSVKQEPIQISHPHQAKWINFERKTCTNSDFRLNDQIW